MLDVGWQDAAMPSPELEGRGVGAQRPILQMPTGSLLTLKPPGQTHCLNS